MKFSTFFFQLILTFISLIAHAISDDFTVQAEKLEDWVGCTATQEQEVRDAWDSAIDIAYVSSGKLDWTFHAARDFLGNEEKNKDYQSTIKGKATSVWI